MIHGNAGRFMSNDRPSVFAEKRVRGRAEAAESSLEIAVGRKNMKSPGADAPRLACGCILACVLVLAAFTASGGLLTNFRRRVPGSQKIRGRVLAVPA